MIARRALLLASAAIAAVRPARAAAEHHVTATDATGRAQTDAPLRIARPFIRGEFPDGVAVLVDGKPGAGQADIKQRWPDGSVKHAIISAAVPKLAAHGTVALTFAPAPRPERTVPDAQALLAAAHDFDAVIQVTDDGAQSIASAKKMIEDGHYTVWAHGPVATTLLCADHGASRTYDMGAARALRPAFHVTFWHASKRIHVRAIAEVAQANNLRDLRYDVVILINGRREFSQNAVPHAMATRWTKVFWADPAPGPAYSIDHAIPYVVRAKFLPPYDTSLKFPDHEAGEYWAGFQKQPTAALYDAGVWTKYMPTTGGRDDIGPTTGLVARWLMSGDARLDTMVRIQADLAGAWAHWLRETDPHKPYDASGAVPAIGHPLSVYARPSLWFDGRDKSVAADKLSIAQPRLYKDDEGWVADGDGAHQPDPFSVPYMLLGDPDLLAQMQMWAAANLVNTDPDYRSDRAPDGRMLPSGAIIGQIRGQAWTLRTRMLAAFLTPDAEPEQAYFAAITDEAIAYWEGRCEITGTRFQPSRLWKLGLSRKIGSALPLFDETRDGIRSNEGLYNDRLTGGTCFWQTWMTLFVLGWARDLGFATGPLLAHCGKMLTGQFAAPERYDPLNVGRYYTGTRDAAGVSLPDWPATLPYYKTPKPDPVNADVNDGYLTYAHAAAALIVDQPGGPEAYAWLRARAYDPNRAAFAANPKWAFVPRA